MKLMPAPTPFRLVFLLSGLLLAAGCKTTDTTRTSLITPRLIKPLEFANFTVSDVSPQGASNLMNEKISVGKNATDAYDIFSSDGTNHIHVETVCQFKAALKDGYYAASTYDMTMQSLFIQAEAVLDFMARAKSSQHSYLGRSIFMDLPVTILDSYTGPGDGDTPELRRDAAKGMTLGHCRRSCPKWHIFDVRCQGNTVDFRCENDGDYWVQELARGDFDHDGCEDALIMVGIYAHAGSGRTFATHVVTRTDPKQRQLKIAGLNAVK